MAKMRRFLLTLILPALLAGWNGGILEARAVQADTRPTPGMAEPVVMQTELDPRIHESYELAAENDTFQMYVNRTTLAFKVLDRRSGYIWHSNLDEVTKDDKLNKTWTAFAMSGISIDYLDQKAISERISITNSDATVNVSLTKGGFEAQVTFNVPSISLVVRVTLEPEGALVEVPFESIRQENPDFKLGLVYVYPFFAATKEAAMPGYMFIPDGSGSIIRFSAVTKAKNVLHARYYGNDLGMLAEIPWNPEVNRPYNLSVPVTGMVHGTGANAYVAVVEKGASYADLLVHPADIITRFNFLAHAFIYNESFFQATNRSGAGVTVLQPETNAFDIRIHYRFLTGREADYVGMAQSYQQYLLDRGILEKHVKANGNISIRLEFLGGEKEKVLFWHNLIPMTTVEQMGDILADLDVHDPEVVYYGWQPLGASSVAPRRFKLDSGLGSTPQLAALVEQIRAGGGNFSLYLDPQAALRGEKGYSPRFDLAMSITNFTLEGYNRCCLNYYRNFDALLDFYPSLVSQIYQELGAGLALDGIGTMLYSDFKKGNFLNREDAISSYQTLLAGEEGATAFYMPNDYMFGQMSAYYDIPLTNNGYVYTSEIVPFLQVVLAGYIPFYGDALNFSPNVTDALLRHVDYGVYPAYFLTREVTARILNTPSAWIFTSSYLQWGAEIERTYHWLNALLGPVEGQEMVARRQLDQGVFATTYANGMQIIVNYRDHPFNRGSVTVEARDAIIREVAP